MPSKRAAKANGGKPAAGKPETPRALVLPSEGVVGWSVIESAKTKLGLTDGQLCHALGYASPGSLGPYKKRGHAPLAIGLAVEGLVARQGRKGSAVFVVTCPRDKAPPVETVLTTLGCSVQRIV